MFKFVLKRLGYMIVTLWIVATITFMLIHIIPGDPLASMGRNLPEQTRQNFMEKYGLNQPVSIQYGKFMKRLVLHGDFGESMTYPGRKVSDLIKQGLPKSARIGLQAVGMGFVIGVTLGIVAAFNRNRWPDYLVMFIALLGVSVPSFVYASLLQYGLAFRLQLFPVSGWGRFANTVLPTLALSLSPIAVYARYMRNNCLDVIGQDYVLTARSKGVSKLALVWKHIIRNAILPAITILGPQIAGVLTGSFVIERIFGVPGLGDAFITSINDRDYTIIMGLTVFMAFLYIISLVFVDILYGLVDPRIRLTGQKR